MDYSRKIIGVDFGSTQSTVSLLGIGATEAPEIIKTSSGNITIPTALLTDVNDSSDVIAWGAEVSQHYKQKNDREVCFVDNFKRYLGVDPANCPSKMRKADLFCKKFIEKLAKFVRDHEGVDELSAKDYATCFAYPATWNDDQINLLKKYAKDAGFPADPEYGIYAISEPIAAMYSLKVKDAKSKSKFYGPRPENFMVIDFGGGTLDICIVRTGILGDQPRIVSTSGDPTLGGHDFDGIIADLFFKKYPDVKKDLSVEEEAELYDRFKEAKEIYSENLAGSYTANYIFHTRKGIHNLEVDKTTFENKCCSAKIFNRISQSIDKALDDAGLSCADIKKIVLTGGSSKWFFMRDIVSQKLKCDKEKDICLTESPFTDVSIGCAVSKGWPNDPPLRPGVWVKAWIDGKPQNGGKPKCILEPSKSDQGSIGDRIYIGEITKTRYFNPYSIEIAFLTGFSEDKLTEDKEHAVIQYYARSNYPILDSIKGEIRVLKHLAYIPLKDKYKIYIECKDNPATGKKYTFVIHDNAASKFNEILNNEGEEEAKKHPRGKEEYGLVIPGNISSGSFFGVCSRKNKEITQKHIG